MQRDRVLAAFATEAAQLSAALGQSTEADWDRPTGCSPWNVAELLGHVVTVLDWLPGMLAADAPAEATVSATGYYRPDERFSARTNATRLDLARQRAAAAGNGPALAAEYDRVWRKAHALSSAEPADRVVRTRHGDSMLLTDFLVTRIVEVGIHGLDLAAALDRVPWLTEPAADLLAELLLGDRKLSALRDLGWDTVTFLARATGRAPLSRAETAQVERSGIRWLALG